MSKNNVRIAIRDSTDSHNVAFFDNISGIRYQSANLQRFLAGSASILTIEYNSKDIDTIRTGCKLAFIYKERAYWLNIMDLSKKGYKVEITAYSLGLELNQEERGAHKPANAMSFAEYLAYYDPEHALELGVNEVADKRIKLEWTGTDTILARLFSIANSFDAELEFTVELNQDYSLKRQVLNVYKKGNLGSNRAASPIRAGRGLKVINYSDNLKELRTAVRATGKDGLTIDGLNKKVYDDDGNLLYYSSGMTVYAPQSRDKYPSVGKKSNDNWIIKELGETEYSTKEALWGYMLGELKKICVPEITYDIEGAVDGDVGDTRTLIDDVHYDPALYVQARISELTEDLITGKVTKSTLTNFERKYSQIADSLLKQVEALAEEAAPYIVRLSTDNGYNFKNGQGTSTITAKLEKYSKIVNAKWKWLINNSVVSETSSVKINASQVNGTLNVVAVAIVGGNEAAREYITFTNADDGVGIKSITRYYTTNDKAEGVTSGGQNWSTKPTTVTTDKKYMWSYDVITYTNDTSLVTKPAVIGARGDDGLDADTTGITEALDKAKQELTALSANIEKVRNDSLEAVEEAKQQLTTVANDLSKAKTDLQNAVSAVDTKATNLQSDLTKAKQDLTSQSQQLQVQGSAQSELTKRVSSVEKTADGTKTTVSELSKTVAQNGKDITSVTARTKTVEDDLLNTKTTLSQVKTTADSTSQKTATLETGLNGLSAKFENLSVGTTNHFLDSAFETTIQKIGILQNGNVYTPSIDTTEKYYGYNTLKIVCKDSTGVDNPKITYPALAKLKTVQQGKLPDVITISFWGKTDTEGMSLYTRLGFTGYEDSQNVTLATDWKRYIVHVKTSSAATNEWLFKFSKAGTVWIAKPQFEFSAIASDYHLAEEDASSKVAEYKQTADQNYASLQSSLQTLDGTVKSNKTTADQTAQGFKTRIESLETYKDGETTRANQYFESAKTETARQLTAERTAIAKDYVAKSTYISDVTGIRNDLSATTTTANTTKTNLANYQASNDKAVANLQSNLQTANGNISSLQTKVEAVPGQITSAVSAVEGKIPTNVSTRNLILKSNDFANPHKQNGANTIVTSTDDYFVIKSTGYTANGWGGMSWNLSISEAKAGEQFSILMPVYIDSSIALDSAFSINIKNHPLNLTAYGYDIPTNKKNEWFNVAVTFKATRDVKFDTYPFYVYLVKNGLVRIKPPMLVRGNLIPTDYQPAFEDTESDINAVSSELKQTKDGMTLLATKTELNTAKSDLQSGITTATSKADNAQATANSNAQTISTHTTQISALNTGLSAKVSQSDFNALSGRVTTAENNITAKANELSSKITSVESKVPTNVSTRNLILKSNDFANPHKQNGANTIVTSTDDYFVIKSTGYTANGWGGMSWNLSISEAKAGEQFSILMPVYIDSSIALDSAFSINIKNHPLNLTAYGYDIPTNKKNEWFNVAVTFKATRDVKFDTYPFYVYLVKNGLVRIKPPILVRGNVMPSDWQPAPEDYDSALATAQSEIKQTTDAIKASVSSLDKSTVKSASLTINTDGIVMKAGKSTTDVANAIGSYFAVNQNAINLFSDKINVKANMIVDGSITSNKIAAGAITADKIKAGSITADMFKGNQITSLNGATTLNLYTGEIIFNNQYATINQIKGSYKSQISLFSLDNGAVNESAWSSVNTLAFNSTKLTSATRRAGSAVDMFPNFSLMTLYGEKIAFTGETSGAPDSQNAIIVNTNSDEVSFINGMTNSSKGAWNYSMIMNFGTNAAISAPDIKLAGHIKSLTGILDDLCKKVGIMWI
ncbi:hypothetical protein [Streptococcus lutetiensis]|uniref:hypothetical protein n=1 Tax=Streptococcus lutetiensis TaxID=150055 RepID=UPI002023F532|nr:hypothetical protein [Streptococcus lutetiensis]